MRKNMRHLNKLSVIGVAFIFAVTALFIYWLFIDDIDITVNNADAVQLDKTAYNVGDRITYTIDYCKREKAVATVTRYLVNDYKITFTEIKSDMPLGCDKFIRNDLVIPEFLVPDGGKYHLEATVTYYVNPIKNKVIHWKTVDFIIK